MAGKKVTFFKTASCRFALHHRKYTPSERQASFYTHSEYEDMRSDVMDVVEMIEEGRQSDIDDETDCVRGAESRTNTARKLRTKQYMQCVAIVLTKQYLENDPTIIASEYAKITVSSTAAAYRMGLADEKAAREEKYSSSDDDDHHQPSTSSETKTNNNNSKFKSPIVKLEGMRKKARQISLTRRLRPAAA